MNSYEVEFEEALHEDIDSAQKYIDWLERLEDVALRVAQWARRSQDEAQPKMRHLSTLHGYWQELQQNRPYSNSDFLLYMDS
ncbi:MAG: hypothetical protein ACPGWR_14830 [Ardenticatenaceae bacterium]